MSYSHKNKETVQKLIKALDNYDVSVWYDEKIEYGQYWDDTVEEELLSSDVMLVALSNESVESKEAKNEWKYWLEYFNKPLIPIIISKCRVPYRLASIQRINAYEKTLDEKTLDGIAKDIFNTILKSTKKEDSKKVCFKGINSNDSSINKEDLMNLNNLNIETNIVNFSKDEDLSIPNSYINKTPFFE